MKFFWSIEIALQDSYTCNSRRKRFARCEVHMDLITVAEERKRRAIMMKRWRTMDFGEIQ